MMFTSFCLLGLICAADPALKTNTPTDLDEMVFLIGKWRGSGEMPELGKYEDEFVYRWSDEGKKFIKAEYVLNVSGKPVWKDETVLGYDPELKAVVGFTFGLDGSIGRGKVIEKKANTWIIEGKSVGATPFKSWRMEIRKISIDRFEVETFQPKDGKWVTMMTSKYNRVKESK